MVVVEGSGQGVEGRERGFASGCCPLEAVT